MKQFLDHTNVIFANRLVLEKAFPNDIKPYDFPPPPHKLIHILNLTLRSSSSARLAQARQRLSRL